MVVVLGGLPWEPHPHPQHPPACAWLFTLAPSFTLEFFRAPFCSPQLRAEETSHNHHMSVNTCQSQTHE